MVVTGEGGRERSMLETSTATQPATAIKFHHTSFKAGRVCADIFHYTGEEGSH